jgi:hypothetical protein
MKIEDINVSNKGQRNKPGKSATSDWESTLIKTKDKSGSRVPNDKGKKSKYDDPSQRKEQRGKIIAGEGSRSLKYDDPINEKDVSTIEIGEDEPKWVDCSGGKGKK